MGKRSFWMAFAAGAALAAGAAAAQPPEIVNDAKAFTSANPPASKIKGPFKIVTIGELLYSEPMAKSPDRAFQAVARLAADGDVTIAEQEGVFLDLKKYKGTPGAGGLIGSPEKARDQKAMGIDMVALANNHSSDWGWEGQAETMRLLDEAGIVHAGAGRNLAEAVKAGILKTPKGKIAMVSTASTVNWPLSNATNAYGEAPARQGISILRTRRVNLVPPAQLAALREVAAAGEQFSHKDRAPKPDATEISFGGDTYRASDKTGVLWEMNPFDHADLMRSVKQAKQDADYVVFTIHAHESPTGRDDDNPEAPLFLEELFHNAVDAGADLIYGHGQHSLRGIEIYKGRPIFYGIGAYFLSGDIKQMGDGATNGYERPGRPLPPIPSLTRAVTANPGGVNPPVWYDTIVATTEYDGPTLKTVHIYPVDTGNTPDKSRRGIPHLADPANAVRILNKLQTISAKYGTKIDIEGSVGVIRVN